MLVMWTCRKRIWKPSDFLPALRGDGELGGLRACHKPDPEDLGTWKALAPPAGRMGTGSTTSAL